MLYAISRWSKNDLNRMEALEKKQKEQVDWNIKKKIII